MPGIVGYCSTDFNLNASEARAGAMISSIRHQPWYKVAMGHGASGCFACIHLGHFDHRIVATTADGKVGVMLDGWVFGVSREGTRETAESVEDAATFCLKSYLERETKFIRDLNGQFNLLIWDDRRGREVFLINDRYGLRPWQYASMGGALYFAPEGKAILAGSGERARLNERMIVNQLSWGRIWIGQETLFEGVLMLPPASVLRWRDGRVSLDQYWDYVYQPEAKIDDEFIDHTVATFRQAIARQASAPLRYGVSLSGGLDSRVVLAALAQKDGRGLRAYSWGVCESNDEVAIACQTAAELGASWRYIPLSPVDFISQAERGAFLTEGLDLAVQSYSLSVYPVMRAETDVAITGLALDLTMGGSYLTESVAAARTSDTQAINTTLNQTTLFSRQECLKLTHLKSAGGILEHLQQQAIAEWSAGQNTHPADKSDRFVLRARVSRFIFMRQMWQRFFLEDVAPTFDNELIDCLLKIPPSWRVGHRFYRKFMQKLAPEVMKIPYQRTLLPPAAPLHLWPLGARLEEQKEELYRQLWHDTRGQVFIPYTRFSTNYDEWLRRDPDWLRMTDDLLLSPNSLSCEKFLNREAVRQLIDDHRSGKSANHKKIIPLLTLETFLRQFFGRGSAGEQESEVLSVSA